MLNVFSIKIIRSVGFVVMALIILACSLGLGVPSLEEAAPQAINHFESVAASKETAIENWVNGLEVSLQNLEESELFSSNMVELLQGKTNPATDESLLAAFRLLIGKGQFDEVFLTNSDGQIILSTNSEKEGRQQDIELYHWKETQTACYQALIQATSVIVACPVNNSEGQIIGFLIGQTSLETLNGIIMDRTGLGMTGEIYLVDTQNRLLTPSRFQEQIAEVKTEAVKKTLETKMNWAGLYENYLGEPVIGVYHWLPYFKLVLVIEQSQAEVLGSK